MVLASSWVAALSAWPWQLLQTHLAARGSNLLGQRAQGLLDLGLGLLLQPHCILFERLRVQKLELVGSV